MAFALKKKKRPAAKLRKERHQSKTVGLSGAEGECPTTGKSNVRMPDTKRIPKTKGSEITMTLAYMTQAANKAARIVKVCAGAP